MIYVARFFVVILIVGALRPCLSLTVGILTADGRDIDAAKISAYAFIVSAAMLAARFVW
jgi:hypothetical protein